MFRRLAFSWPKAIRRFLSDTRAVAAVEFALVAPVLIFAYMGMADLTMRTMAARKTEHAAATIGDLAAQSDNLTAANITDLWTIGGSMLQPFDTTVGLKMRISQVTMQSNGSAIVTWSNPTSNWTGYAKNQAMPQITTTQLPINQSLIMTDIEYDYASPFGNFLPGSTVFTYTFYHHPRNGAQVTNVG